MLKKKKSKFICLRPLKEIVVLADGRITTCCLDPKGNNTFASIYEDDFATMLKKFQRFKEQLVKNPKNFPVCQKCLFSRRDYYNEFHKSNPSGDELQSFLAVDAVPRQLVIELTVTCNMTCVACISGKREIKHYRKTENGLFLDTAKLQQWLTSHMSQVHAVRLFNYGETFLHPKAIEFCDFLTASNPDIYLIIATNLLPLDNEEKIKQLIQAQPNALYVSLHGAHQDSVSKYMGPPANFDRALDIMKTIITLRGNIGYEAPLVVWKYILFDWNDSDEEMQRATLLAKQNNIDYIGFEITNGPIASKRFFKGSSEFESLKNSEYFINRIYGEIGRKRIKRTSRQNNPSLSQD